MITEKNCVYLDPRTMKKFKVLIVDDNDFFRQTLKISLQGCFPTIVIEEAVDGAKALQKVDNSIPDLIFMDIRLPGENGLELTKKIKTTHPNIIIFILTTYDIPEYQRAASQCGADRFLSKSSLNPTGLEDLVRFYANA